MSEFHASRAREITDNFEEFSNGIWYSKFKDGLFDNIKTAALKGNKLISITHNVWDCNESKMNFLISNLVSLGYSVKVENNVMLISW